MPVPNDFGTNAETQDGFCDSWVKLAEESFAFWDNAEDEVYNGMG